MNNLTKLIDEITGIVNRSGVADAPETIMRTAGYYGNNALAVEALARLLVIETARRKHAEAKLAEAERRAFPEAR